MSVSSTTSSISYSGNASTSTAYPVPFQFIDATDLVVVVNTAGVPTTLVNGTGYTVSGGAGSTGSVVTTSAIPNTSSVIITRATAKTQLTSYTTGDRFPASTHEKALDKLTMLVQEATGSAVPPSSTATGAAPFVLQAATAGATPTWVPQSSGGIAAGAITNTMLAGGITPGKLSTGAPVWDTSGNLTANSFVGPVTGNAATASSAAKLTTPRTIGLSGDVTGTASFDGSANATIAATIPAGTVTVAKLGTNEQKQIAKAWVNFNGTNGGVTGLSYSRASTTVTVTSTAHGLSTGMTGQVYSATDAGLNGSATITVINANSFSFQTISTGTASGTLSYIINIRSSYNVSSITKNGTGSYTVNLAAPMADANYTVIGTSPGRSNVSIGTVAAVTSQTTANFSIQMLLINSSNINNPFDPDTIHISVFGN